LRGLQKGEHSKPFGIHFAMAKKGGKHLVSERRDIAFLDQPQPGGTHIVKDSAYRAVGGLGL